MPVFYLACCKQRPDENTDLAIYPKGRAQPYTTGTFEEIQREDPWYQEHLPDDLKDLRLRRNGFEGHAFSQSFTY